MNCKLCQKNKSEAILSFELAHVYQSSFGEKWPGSLMLVYKYHEEDLCDLKRQRQIILSSELILLEKSIKKITKAKRMNVVKFGNVVNHLHWHLIPRYAEEKYPQQNPWEIQHHSLEELYEKIPSFPNLQESLLQEIYFQLQNKTRSTFSSLLLIKPISPSYPQPQSFHHALCDIQKNPQDFECLLMKRNYDDFSFDHMGGFSEENETPFDTIIREAKEEINFYSPHIQEVSKQWKYGILGGFVFMALDDLGHWPQMPLYYHKEEIQELKFFPLLDILNEPYFPEKVKSRIYALIHEKRDIFL